ncbi:MULTISPECIES: hypothetical protein [unclassified Ensifer]|uniref:hypothetical protein n=1 Tax=Ensifer TaxID=106591 RepID=UPI00070B2481|nr:MULTISPECIES: hypothetical protein [unclassified Ensifer]KQU96015.1 hypothetical protein ASD00_19880 [Ensifer sp. Root31]KQW34945.1 hypothetical protein ASD02_17225 [Ensifer sp. Root1252]KRC57269.1 hypothetical protein ASE32_20540 [Ensifer sp. Root231]KRC87764.1 hypothetical protein ASE47_14695 [Ensifer sp. Root258]
MSKIPAPKLPEGHPDRDLLCQEALEAEFLSLGDRAYQAGWSREEFAMAMMELADGYFLANADLEMFELGAGLVRLARKLH